MCRHTATSELGAAPEGVVSQMAASAAVQQALQERADALGPELRAADAATSQRMEGAESQITSLLAGGEALQAAVERDRLAAREVGQAHADRLDACEAATRSQATALREELSELLGAEAEARGSSVQAIEAALGEVQHKLSEEIRWLDEVRSRHELPLADHTQLVVAWSQHARVRHRNTCAAARRTRSRRRRCSTAYGRSWRTAPCDCSAPSPRDSLPTTSRARCRRCIRPFAASISCRRRSAS